MFHDAAKTPQKMSDDEALALFVDTKMTKNQYNVIKQNNKKHNADIYPNYNKLLEAKKRCYPPGIVIDEISAEIPLQALVDHTIDRLITVQIEVLNHISERYTISSLKMWFKWGCDGAAGQSRYKQTFNNSEHDDSFIFSISLVPLRLVVESSEQTEILAWQNPATSSTKHCRPIKIIFKQEQEEFVKQEIEKIKREISSLVPRSVNINDREYSCVSVFSLTMIDGKICSWLSNSSSQNCHLCHATPKMMNNIEEVRKRPIVADNMEFGISSLHAWIKCFECLLHISYGLFQ